MFHGTLSDGEATVPIQDAFAERVNVAQQATPVRTDLSNSLDLNLHLTNSVHISRGETAGKAWVLVARGDVDLLDLNSEFEITFQIDQPNSSSLAFKGFVVCREPQAVTPGLIASDPNGMCVLELADARWRVHNPYFSVSASKIYNVSTNSGLVGVTSYLPSSLNSGSPWTWAEMVEDLWSLMESQLGEFPGLPVIPDGEPRGWLFQGVPAWQAVTQILDRIGCEVALDPRKEVGAQCSIVQVGADDANADAIIAAADSGNLKIHDAEFQAISRKVPEGVRVFFHKQTQTSITLPPWLQSSVYTVDVAGTDPNAETGVYHPIWDDLQAIYDDEGTLTNSSELDDRAQERADDYYRQLGASGNARSWYRYSGLIAISPGSSVRAVTWRSWGATGANETDGGAHTDIARYPSPTPTNRDYHSAGTVNDLIRLGFPNLSDGVPSLINDDGTLPVTTEDGDWHINSRDASALDRGVVNTEEQHFGGLKEFDDGLGATTASIHELDGLSVAGTSTNELRSHADPTLPLGSPIYARGGGAWTVTTPPVLTAVDGVVSAYNGGTTYSAGDRVVAVGVGGGAALNWVYISDTPGSGLSPSDTGWETHWAPFPVDDRTGDFGMQYLTRRKLPLFASPTFPMDIESKWYFVLNTPDAFNGDDDDGVSQDMPGICLSGPGGMYFGATTFLFGKTFVSGLLIDDGLTPSIALGDISGLGTGVADYLGTPSPSHFASMMTGPVGVNAGGTGQTSLTSNQLIAGNGTSAVNSMANTRNVSGDLQLKIGSDRWIGFSKGSA